MQKGQIKQEIMKLKNESMELISMPSLLFKFFSDNWIYILETKTSI